MKLLIVVDMQNDFITGSLGTPEAQAIVPKVVDKIKNWDKDGEIWYTQDTHTNNYLDTQEGRNLPVVHCVFGEPGHEVEISVKEAIESYFCKKNLFFRKKTFGSKELFDIVSEDAAIIDSIEIIGLCTDICVVSNALGLKAYVPEIPISCDASCCAGTTPENHKAALQVMKCCQINVYNEEE